LICFNLALFHSIPRTNSLKNTSKTKIKQWKWMLFEEIARKTERKIWWKIFRSEKMSRSPAETFRVFVLYLLLIIL
jgi:hypothetical protein